MSTNDIGSISELMRVARATNFEDMIWFTRTYYQITMRHLGIEGSVSIDGEAPNSSFKLVSGVTNIFLMGNVFQTGDYGTTRANLATSLRHMSNEQGKSWVTWFITMNNGSPSIEFWSSYEQGEPYQDGPWDCERDQAYVRDQVYSAYMAWDAARDGLCFLSDFLFWLSALLIVLLNVIFLDYLRLSSSLPARKWSFSHTVRTFQSFM